ncbi:hypothetical protein AAIH25_19915 [Arthrobacter crystallopoietes]|uniref:hypothetical protein n=1 Tax=Crystallibacter crystallopoietes TaxID=37928 RepID=UPI003D1AA62A
MGFDPSEPEQRAMLRSALEAAGISVGDLWLHYFSLGGAVGEYEVEAYLQGLLALPALQRDLLAMAANELIEEIPRPRAPYSDEFTGDAAEPRHQPEAEESADQSRPDGQDRE